MAADLLLCVCEQAQHDYLQGNYPVVREDAAQVCALQMQAEAGPTWDITTSLDDGLERYLPKQVGMHSCTYRIKCTCLLSECAYLMHAYTPRTERGC